MRPKGALHVPKARFMHRRCASFAKQKPAFRRAFALHLLFRFYENILAVRCHCHSTVKVGTQHPNAAPIECFLSALVRVAMHIALSTKENSVLRCGSIQQLLGGGGAAAVVPALKPVAGKICALRD